MRDARGTFFVMQREHTALVIPLASLGTKRIFESAPARSDLLPTDAVPHGETPSPGM